MSQLLGRALELNYMPTPNWNILVSSLLFLPQELVLSTSGDLVLYVDGSSFHSATYECLVNLEDSVVLFQAYQINLLQPQGKIKEVLLSSSHWRRITVLVITYDHMSKTNY